MKRTESQYGLFVNREKGERCCKKSSNDVKCLFVKQNSGFSWASSILQQKGGVG